MENTNRFIRVRARFVSAVTGLPLTGGQYSVRLFDLDPVTDDYLGESTVYGAGLVEVLFSLADASSWDSPGELMPDLYMVLYEGTRQIYRTPVKFNVEIPLGELLTQQAASTVDLGEFKVP